MKNKSLVIRVSGRVQGVGFRYSTLQAAVSTGVTGWVRNERDGTVLIHCEGPSSSVDKFVKWCRKGPSLSHVVALNITEQPFRGIYNGFKVEY